MLCAPPPRPPPMSVSVYYTRWVMSDNLWARACVCVNVFVCVCVSLCLRLGVCVCVCVSVRENVEDIPDLGISL